MGPADGSGPIPTAGEDVAVFNDLNIFDNDALTNSNNQTLVRNLVNFTSEKPRGTGTVVWWDNGRFSAYGTSTCGSTSSNMATTEGIMQSEGFTVVQQTTTSGSLVSIPANVKVIWLWQPTVAFTRDEINALKLFAAEGGRSIFVGEHSGFYPQIAIENQFLADMGAQMTNQGALIQCGRVNQAAAQVRTHQITAGMTGYRMECASLVIPGPNDFPLLFAFSGATEVPIGGVAKIDTTPLPPQAVAPSPALVMAPIRSAPNRDGTGGGAGGR